jgi:methionine-rich copper-binding protein CopC
MNTSKSRVAKFSTLLTMLFFATILLTFNALTAHAQDKSWTTVGSGGATEDESNPAKPTYTNFAASVNAGQPAGTYILRYNVVAVDGLFVGGNTLMTVRYRDSGPGSRVLVELKRTNINSGGVEVVATFDSDLNPNPNAFTTAFTPLFPHFYDFAAYGYWLEVTMTKGADDQGLPSFAVARVQTF